MRMLFFPLAVLVFLSILSTTGLGDSLSMENSTVTMVGSPDTYYYDVDGNIVCYQNGTAYYSGDNGFIHVVAEYATTQTYYWYNGTWPSWDKIELYDNPYGIEDDSGTVTSGNFDIGSSVGLIAVIVTIMGIVSIIGLRVVGSGMSETSVRTILFGVTLITVWGIFSALSLTLLTEIPLYIGGVFYFVLTIMYTLGIIQTIGASE